MDIAALLISLLALLISYTSVIFGKNLEIRVKKFDDLVLEELKLKFSKLDMVFENNPSDNLSIHLNSFTDIYVEIVLYLLSAKPYFKSINIDIIQDELSTFSDELYKNPMLMVSEKRSDYKIHKMKIICLIYEQSINYASKWRILKWISN